MFTLSEIAELKKAGYSITEILAIDSGNPPQPTPEQPAPEQPAPEQPAPEQTAPEQPVNDPMTIMMQKIDEMIGEIKRGNIRNMSINNPDSDNSTETILAKIINPPDKSNKGK